MDSIINNMNSTLALPYKERVVPTHLIQAWAWKRENMRWGMLRFLNKVSCATGINQMRWVRRGGVSKGRDIIKENS